MSIPEYGHAVPIAEKIGKAKFATLVKNAEAWAKTHLYPHYIYKAFAEQGYDKYPADDKRELKIAVERAVKLRQAQEKKEAEQLADIRKEELHEGSKRNQENQPPSAYDPNAEAAERDPISNE